LIPTGIVAHSLNLAQGVGDAIAAYLVCRSSICPSEQIHSLIFLIGSRSPDRIHNADGQPFPYVYSRGSEAEARRAKMLTKDEARRIAVKVTRGCLSLSGRPRGTARCLGALVAADNG
jgi:hypothetical protein